jgi:CheY-like chemotaxis protein
MSSPAQISPRRDPPGERPLRSIAHDLNNILLAIQIQAKLALKEGEGSGSAARSLVLILDAARRGEDLVRQIADHSRQGGPAQPKRGDSPEPGPRGTERILFVDDEEMQVRAMTKLLEHLGYRVVGLTDAVEALEEFRKEPEAFDLAIMDQTMPRLEGDRMAREILRIRPGFPIILCSGYTETLDEPLALALGIRAFIMKPFTVREIAETIRRVLETGP